jgi:hypothetical protein
MIPVLLVPIRTIQLVVPVLAAAAIAGACGGEAFSSRQTSSSGGSSAGGNTHSSGNGGAQGGSPSGNAGNSPGGRGNLGCEEMAECEDDNPCTLDICNSDGICLQVPIDSLCESDDNDCTSDVCSGGLCTHPANGTCDCTENAECDDSNPCTNDACDNGSCQYQNNTDPCADDNNECTNDLCLDGTCAHENNEAPCADEGDECTDDVCGGGLCTHPANGQCGCQDNPECDDSNPCTDDTCDPDGDCQYENNTGACGDDGNACTSDVCSEGTCNHVREGQPIPEKSTWNASASNVPQVPIGGCFGDASEPPSQGIDGMPATRWTSGKIQSGGEWFQVDFGVPVTLNHINLDSFGLGTDNCASSGNDYPRHYEVRVSNTSIDKEAAVLTEGEGTPGNTLIQLPQPATGRYLLISQTGFTMQTIWWSIHELNVACQ